MCSLTLFCRKWQHTEKFYTIAKRYNSLYSFFVGRQLNDCNFPNCPSRPIHKTDKSNKGGCKDSELEEKYIQEASWLVIGRFSLTVFANFSCLLTPKSATFRCPESSRSRFLLSYSWTIKKLFNTFDINNAYFSHQYFGKCLTCKADKKSS